MPLGPNSAESLSDADRGEPRRRSVRVAKRALRAQGPLQRVLDYLSGFLTVTNQGVRQGEEPGNLLLDGCLESPGPICILFS
jgi:hypothetical protein